MDDTILIFTRKGIPSFLRDGGSGNWKVRAERVNRLRFAVLCRNRNAAETIEGDEPHGTGFLVARINGLVPSPTRPGRWIIRFSSIAGIDMPDLWPGYRNPTVYTSLAELGIDPDQLDWQPMSADTAPDEPGSAPADAVTPVGEIIRRWKAALAKELGVSPGQIKVSLRG